MMLAATRDTALPLGFFLVFCDLLIFCLQRLSKVRWTSLLAAAVFAYSRSYFLALHHVLRSTEAPNPFSLH